MITVSQADKDIHGPNIFTVMLGSQQICRFDHDKLEGLADCLHKAADAVEQSDWAEYVMMDDSKGG